MKINDKEIKAMLFQHGLKKVGEKTYLVGKTDSGKIRQTTSITSFEVMEGIVIVTTRSGSNYAVVKQMRDDSFAEKHFTDDNMVHPFLKNGKVAWG